MREYNTGNVRGPASATDGTVAIYDGTTGRLIKAGGAVAANLVTAGAVITDNRIVRGDGGARGVQESVVTIADTTGDMSGVGALGCGTITTTGNLVLSTALATVDGRDVSVDGTKLDGIPTPAYCSQTVTAASNASAAEYDIFLETNYAAFTHTANVPDTGIVFTHTDGRFTVAVAGNYWINPCLRVSGNAAWQNDHVRIKVNGATVFDMTFISPNAGNDLSSFGVILPLTAGQYINVTIENETGVNTTTIQANTTLNITRIS